METLYVYPSKTQEAALIAFLNQMDISYSKEDNLPPHVIEGINSGLEDVKQGRTITLKKFLASRKAI